MLVPAAASPARLRLHLGSGAHCPRTWTNLDNSPGAWLGAHPRLFAALKVLLRGPAARLLPAANWPDNCMRRDLTRPLPFPDASAVHVYTAHFLEHLSLEEGRGVLRECRRVLAPGGLLRVVVPDLEQLVRAYLAQRESAPGTAAETFHRDSYFFEVPAPRRLVDLPLYHVRRRHNHSFLYDEPALRAELVAAGFSDVRRRAFGDSDIPDILEVETEDRLRGAVCLEARRP